VRQRKKKEKTGEKGGLQREKGLDKSADLCHNFHSTAQHSTAQHSTAQHSTAQHSTAQA
jgi:hypothetical protein